jgi:hypothetical protein
MPSPFPGMDPYLEDPELWPAFQHQLLQCFYQILLPGLVDRYRARIAQRRYDAGEHGEQSEEAIEIRSREVNSREFNKLVTLLEVVSPVNKTTDAGRQAYFDTRRGALDQKAGIVEIDLVLQGKPTLTYSREGLPEFDHSVSVTRGTVPDRYEIYTATLQKRLPKFKVPLAPDDRDVILDLQSAFSRAYDLGGFGARIIYENDPPVKLNDETSRWLDQHLRAHGLRREPAPCEDEIAVAAYFLWQQQGCPPGRAAEHWNEAKEQLRGRGHQ